MEFVRKLLSGFAIGLGFAIAFALVAYISIDPIMESLYKESAEKTQENMDWSYNASSNALVISNEVNHIDENGIEVTGVVTNNDERGWSNIKIELELFDENGNFVHECSGYISSTVEPEDSENFKVSCKGCKIYNIPEFASHKLRVVDAHSF